jgi:hypothetical protein
VEINRDVPHAGHDQYWHLRSSLSLPAGTEVAAGRSSRRQARCVWESWVGRRRRQAGINVAVERLKRRAAQEGRPRSQTQPKSLPRRPSRPEQTESQTETGWAGF